MFQIRNSELAQLGAAVALRHGNRDRRDSFTARWSQSPRGEFQQGERDMIRLVNYVVSFVRKDDGQDLLEYGILASLIALAVMGLLTMVSDTISNVLWRAIAAVKL